MQLFQPALLLTVLVSTVSGGVLSKHCRQDECMNVAGRPPYNQPGCSAFFKKTFTPPPVTSTHVVTVTNYPTGRVTDTSTTSTVTYSTSTDSFTETDTFASVISTETTTTTTTITPTTVPSTSTTTSTSTSYTSTSTETDIITIAAPGGFGNGSSSPNDKRDPLINYLIPNPPCPTAPAGPSKLPAYARCCGNTAAYSSACSCIGAQHKTTTLQPCTTYVKSTVTVNVGGTTDSTTTTTATVTSPQTTSATTTTSTTTTTTTTSTSTTVFTSPTTITDGLTVTTTVTTTTGVSTTTTLTTLVTVCTLGADFKLEIAGLNVPITMEELELTSDADPNKRLVPTLPTDPNIQRFHIETSNAPVKPGLATTSDPRVANSTMRYFEIGDNSIINVSPASTTGKDPLYCGVSTNPDMMCKYPVSCYNSYDSYLNGLAFSWKYCDGTGTPLQGLYASPGSPADSSCGDVTLKAISYPL